MRAETLVVVKEIKQTTWSLLLTRIKNGSMTVNLHERAVASHPARRSVLMFHFGMVLEMCGQLVVAVISRGLEL